MLFPIIALAKLHLLLYHFLILIAIVFLSHRQCVHTLQIGGSSMNRYKGMTTGMVVDSSCASFPITEIQALREFYEAGGGRHWKYPKDGVPWNFTELYPNPCIQNWSFVGCASNNCSVTKLVFQQSNFSGYISESIGNLTNLIVIDIQNEKKLNGILPRSIVNLEVLQLSNNDIQGVIPGQFGLLLRLSKLVLYNNSIIGTIPHELGNCGQLFHLDLGGNHLRGAIPRSLYNLTLLVEFLLNENALDGSIANDIGNLHNLKLFDASNNDLTGSLPDSFDTLKNVRFFRLSFNKFFGELPKSIWNMHQLEIFYLNNNLFSGIFTPLFANATTLKEFNISYNSFTGTFPYYFGDLLRGLNTFYVDHNFMSGRLPKNIGKQLVQTQSFSHNMFTGPLPPSILKQYVIFQLYVDNNLLSGTLPVVESAIQNYSQLSFANNFISGSLSISVISTPNLVSLYGSDNMLTGPIPAGFAKCTHLSAFLLATNHLTGSLPDWSQDVALTQFDVSNNQLTGSIPGSLFTHAPNLTLLALINNCLDGSIPSSICTLRGKQLSTLAMDGVHASSHCRVKLFIPTISTYLLQDPLKGSIPGCLFTDFPDLVVLHLSGNGIEGKLPDIDRITTKLTNLTLSHNFLSGTIPQVFWKHNWRKLDLSYNKFTGVMNNITLLPNIITNNNTKIQSVLYLNENRLSGNIPNSNSLKSLQYVNILSGNLFRCSITSSSLPKYDPHYSSYQCGSIFTDASIYAWISCFVVFFVVLVITWYFRHKLTGMTEFYDNLWSYWLVFSETTLDVTVAGLLPQQIGSQPIEDEQQQQEEESVESINKQKQIEQQQNEIKRLTGIKHFAQVCRILHRWIVLLTFILFLIYIPISYILTIDYSTYRYSYVWQISSAYVAGNIPTGLYFTIVTITLFLYRFPKDCHPNYQHSQALKNLKGIDARLISSSAELTRSSFDTGLSTMSPLYFSSKQATPTPTTTASNNENDDEETPATLTKLPWTYRLIWYLRLTAFLLYNLTMVFTVNITYVYFTSAGSSHLTAVQKEFAAIFVSLYKICYNAFMITMLRWLGPRKFYLLPDLGSSIKIVPHKSNMSLVMYMLIISVCNQVLVPAISVMIFSDNCFYNAFVPASTITTNLNYEIGEVNDRKLFSTGQYVTVNSYYTFSPPFTYSFQCSSQLLVSFTPVFVYRFLIDGLLFPCLLVLLKKWQLWGYARKGWQSNVYQYVTMFLNSSLRPIGLKEWDDVNATTVFSGDRFTVGLVCDIAIILSFGTAFPVLAIIGAISVCVRSVFLQLTIGRVVVMSRQYPDLQEFVERTSAECRKVGRTLLRTMPASMWLMSVFWSTFLFDMMGDQQRGLGLGTGSALQNAICISVTMAIAVPLLIAFSNTWIDRSSRKEEKVDKESLGIELRETTLAFSNVQS